MVTGLLLREPGKTGIDRGRVLLTDSFLQDRGGGEEVEIMSEVSAEEVTAEQLKKRKLQEEEEDGVVCIE